MRTFLILTFLLASNKLSKTSAEVTHQKKPTEQEVIFQQVIKNHPKLDKKYATKLSKIIVRKSKKHGVSPKILAAILMQESSYKIGAKNIQCGVSRSTGKSDCVVVDFGIGQINHKTIKNFKFDKNKILSDLTYSVEAAAIVLADFKRMYGKREEFYWTRYNSSKPSKRETYRLLVSRYM